MTCVGRFLAVVFCPGQVACAALLWLRLVTQGRLAWAPLIHFAYFAKGHTTWEQVTSIQNLVMPVDPVSGQWDEYNFGAHVEAGLQEVAHSESRWPSGFKISVWTLHS